MLKQDAYQQAFHHIFTELLSDEDSMVQLQTIESMTKFMHLHLTEEQVS